MLPKVEKAAFPFNLAIMSLCIKCLLHSASDAKWRLHSFFSFSVITLPLISFLCFLSLSILLRFVSLSFAHSVNLYFWLECGSDSRDNIFLFAVSSVLNLSFGWWNFHTTHTHKYCVLDCNFYPKYNLKCIFCRMQMNVEMMMMLLPSSLTTR